MIEIGSKTAEKNSAQKKQTDRQTDKPTDTTKIMATWPRTKIEEADNQSINKPRCKNRPSAFEATHSNVHLTILLEVPHVHNAISKKEVTVTGSRGLFSFVVLPMVSHILQNRSGRIKLVVRCHPHA